MDTQVNEFEIDGTTVQAPGFDRAGFIAFVDRARVTDLRTRLDWSQTEISELRTEASDARKRADMLAALNQGAQDRIRELEALTAGVVDENEAVESPETVDSTTTGISTHMETETPPDSKWWRWWRVITGA